MGFNGRRPRPRSRHIPGQMNKTEQAYAAHLEAMKQRGEIADYQFEACKLRLTTKDGLTTYTPDFVVTTQDEIQMHEVKGFWEDDARLKIKIAADHWWQFRFLAFSAKPKKDGGGWKVEEF